MSSSSMGAVAGEEALARVDGRPGWFSGAKVPEDLGGGTIITPADALDDDLCCCWATAAATASDLVPRVDEEHTVVASSSCWEVPAAAFFSAEAAAAADVEEGNVFLG